MSENRRKLNIELQQFYEGLYNIWFDYSQCELKPDRMTEFCDTLSFKNGGSILVDLTDYERGRIGVAVNPTRYDSGPDCPFSIEREINLLTKALETTLGSFDEAAFDRLLD